MIRKALTVLLAIGVFAACDDSTGVDGAGNLNIAFATSTGTASQTAGSASMVESTAQTITVTGTNGTLTIDEIYLIVTEFELEGELANCETATEEDPEDECEEFEAPMTLIQLPTDGTPLNVVTDAVPLGSYVELGWEVEDVSLDDAEEDEQEIQAVLSDIEAIFGADVWPAEASMAVIGSFQADGASTATDFTTFFDAEIGLWMELNPALEITEEGSSRELTIVLSPEIWFQNTDGTVMDLSAVSGDLIEFEAEFEEGVLAIERDDD